MQKIVLGLVLLGHCLVLSAQENVEQNNSEKLIGICSDFMPERQNITFVASDLMKRTDQTSRNNIHYLFDRALVTKDWLVIDLTRDEALIANTLKLPLHSLKFKKFLLERDILLLGDGINYRALEKEVAQLRRVITGQVKIYFGGVPRWNSNADLVQGALSITAAEYVNESQLGEWAYIYNAADLAEVITRNKKTPRKLLTRYLIMNEQLSSELGSDRYQFFQLKGGGFALEQFSVDQRLMLSASQERVLRSRCKGMPNA